MEALAQWMPLMLGVAFAVLEIPTNRKRDDAGSRDRGSYGLIMGVIGGGFFVAFFLANLPALFRFGFGVWADWAAVALFIGGAALRLWAVQTLGRYFTRQVRTTSDQPVIDTGPYHLIRHPAYTGAIIEILGVALTARNLISVALVAVCAGVALGYRIRIEEQALLADLGERYRVYMGRTKRLVPFVF